MLIFKQKVDTIQKWHNVKRKRQKVFGGCYESTLACDNVCDYGAVCAQPCVGNKEYNA